MVHFGNLYEPRVDVSPLLATLQSSGRWTRIIFALYGSDWTGALKRIPEAIEIERRDPVPWRQAMDLASDYDVALALGNRNPAQLPSKAVQYLTLPIPRLAVTERARGDALAEYVKDKPGWLTIAADDPDAGQSLAHHLGRTWSPNQLVPPLAESWPAVAEEVVAFLDTCFDPIQHVGTEDRPADGRRTAVAR
jgi:hypothetical protein